MIVIGCSETHANEWRDKRGHGCLPFGKAVLRGGRDNLRYARRDSKVNARN